MGWNGSEGKSSAVSGKPQRTATVISRWRFLWWILVGLAAIVIGIAAWLLVGSGTESRKDDVRDRPKKSIQHKITKRETQASETPKRLPMPELSGVRIERREDIPAPQPLEEMNAAATNQVAQKKIPFKNGMEQLIALAMPTEPGSPVPPLPPITDESVAAHVESGLGNIIKAEEGDSPELLEKKIAVASAKDEFRNLRDTEGWGFVEYINALRDKANLDSQFLSEAHRICDELYHDSNVSDDAYISYRDQINEKLRERGLPEIETEEQEQGGME